MYLLADEQRVAVNTINGNCRDNVIKLLNSACVNSEEIV